VGAYRVDDALLHVPLPQKLRRFDTMLIRVFFKINIMEQSHNAPVIGIRRIICFRKDI
jgi:hypothetical protein